MKPFLTRKYLWEIVESRYEDSVDWCTLIANHRTTKREPKKKNYQALFHVKISPDKSLFPRITGEKLAKKACKTLQ